MRKQLKEHIVNCKSTFHAMARQPLEGKATHRGDFKLGSRVLSDLAEEGERPIVTVQRQVMPGGYITPILLQDNSIQRLFPHRYTFKRTQMGMCSCDFIAVLAASCSNSHAAEYAQQHAWFIPEISHAACADIDSIGSRVLG